MPRAKVERFIVPLLADAIERELAKLPAPRTGARAVDVGCGRQPFRARLQAAGYTYTGLDTQPNPDGTTDLICAIDRPLPPEARAAGPFDLILCTEVLEHVADWATAFDNLRTLLAPGGHVLITCPHVYILHEEPYDFWRPTPHAIAHYAQRAGLQVLRNQRLGTAWDVLGTQLAAFKPKPRPGSLPGLSHALAGLTRLSRGLLFRLIATGLPQRLITDGGSLYLSNLAVLRRPTSP